MELLDFQGKKWQVVGKIRNGLVRDGNNLKEEWKCDMVIRNQTHYFILDEIIDAEFEEVE